MLVALLSGALFAATGSARAQVSVGDSVRVRVTGALRVEAMTAALRGDTLLLTVRGLMTPWPVPVAHLESLEAFVDRSPRDGLRYGLALGASAGVFAGALGGLGLYATGVGREADDQPSDLMSVVLSWTGIGLVGGAVVGAVVGAARPGRGWVVVPLPRW